MLNVKLRWHRRPDRGPRWAETVSTACYQRGLGQATKPAESQRSHQWIRPSGGVMRAPGAVACEGC